MARHFSIVLLLAVLLAHGYAAAFDQRTVLPRGKVIAASGTVQVLFPPDEDATGTIIQAINHAQRQVLVQAFSFTSKGIGRALIVARQRGLDVQVIADDEQIRKNERTEVTEIASMGVPTYLDNAHTIAHNKVMVIDGNTSNPVLITGSFNFTNAAQYHNAENLLLFRGNRDLTAAYLDNWQRHRAHSLPFSQYRGNGGNAKMPRYFSHR